LAGSFSATGGVGALLEITDHTASKNYFAAYDHNGNVAALVRDDGTLAAVYEYSPFGEPLRAEVLDSDIADNPFRFSTKYTDVESGLVYYGMRYYSPSLGRFINRDPIEEAGGINLYGFVGNDPVNRLDRLGLKQACTTSFLPEYDKNGKIIYKPHVHCEPTNDNSGSHNPQNPSDNNNNNNNNNNTSGNNPGTYAGGPGGSMGALGSSGPDSGKDTSKSPNINQSECDRLASAIKRLNQSNVDSSHRLVDLGWTGGYNSSPVSGPSFASEVRNNANDEALGIISAVAGLAPGAYSQAIAATLSGADLARSNNTAGRILAGAGTADSLIKLLEIEGIGIGKVAGMAVGKIATIGNYYMAIRVVGIPLLNELHRVSEQNRGPFEGISPRLQGEAFDASNRIQNNNDQLLKISAKIKTLGCK
jgi:RHS repeat-associated protein